MKPFFYFLLAMLVCLVPLCAIYWFLVREYLLLRVRMELARLHTEVLSFARRMEAGSSARAEALAGHVGCLRFKRDLEDLDFGDVLIQTFETRRSVAFAPLDARIEDEDAATIYGLQQKFSGLVMSTVMINSPALFPVVAALFLCAEWSVRARRLKERVQSGAMEVARLSPGMVYA